MAAKTLIVNKSFSAGGRIWPEDMGVEADHWIIEGRESLFRDGPPQHAQAVTNASSFPWSTSKPLPLTPANRATSEGQPKRPPPARPKSRWQ